MVAISQAFRPQQGSRSSGSRARRNAGRILTGDRSDEYLQLIRSLDSESAVSDVATADVHQRIDGELADERLERFEREFSAAGATAPLGLIAHCYLGWPHDVHTLTWSHDVITHYYRTKPLPPELEHARRWARSTKYVAVEVYADHVVCLLENGSAVKVRG